MESNVYIELKNGSIPLWDGLPELELYMDQVMTLLNRYYSVIRGAEDDEAITKNMINNYVKMKAVPAPVRKKYSRKHLACLLMVCVMKQVFSISLIKSAMPDPDDEEGIKDVYNAFVRNLKTAEDENFKRLKDGGFIRLSAEAVVMKIMAESTAANRPEKEE